MVTTAAQLGTVHFGAAVTGQCWDCGSRARGGVKLRFRKPSSVPRLMSEAGDASRKAGFRQLMGWLWDPAKREQRPESGSVNGGVDFWDVSAAAAAQPERFPEHLIIMVNGIVGSADNWKYAAQQFVKKLGDKVIVHRSQSNYLTLTFDGVDLMGERLAEEVFSVVNHRPGVRKISFVAHSLGGLVARYAIGRLYKPDIKSDGPMAGLEPVNFITVATPHLGSRGHKQLPFLCGLPFLERSASQTAHLIVGRTGRHLFLTDNDDGKPLLLRMVDDCNGLKFRSALRSFRRRVAYANANFDHMVGWRTSSIRRQDELPSSHLLVSDERYPHIVYVDKGNAVTVHKEAYSAVRVQTVDHPEEEMIRGLTQVPWERIDVSFRESTQRYVAHSTIQVKSYWMNSDGADVVSHIIDNFII